MYSTMINPSVEQSQLVMLLRVSTGIYIYIYIYLYLYIGANTRSVPCGIPRDM